MRELHLSTATCRYADQPVILRRITSPQDHYRTYVRVHPCGGNGQTVAHAGAENLFVDDSADRANLEQYFERGGGVVHLRCRSSGPHQCADALR